MPPDVVRFHCPFAGFGGCQDGGGRGLTKSSLIVHLRDRHFGSESRSFTRQLLGSNLSVFSAAEVTFQRMGVWLCGGECFKTHSLSMRCRHLGGVVVGPPDGVSASVLHGFTRPPSVTLEVQGSDPVCDLSVGTLGRVLAKGLRTVRSIPPKCRLGFSRVLVEALDAVVRSPSDISCWVALLVLPICILKVFSPRSNLECRSGIRRQRQEEAISSAIQVWSSPGGCLQLLRVVLDEDSPFPVAEGTDLTVQQCRRKIQDGHYSAAVRVLSSSGVAPFSEGTLAALRGKHPEAPPPVVPSEPIGCEPLSTSSGIVRDMIRGFPRGTSCGRDGLRAQHLLDCLSGAAVAVSDDLTTSIAQVVNLFLAGRCPRVLGEFVASAPLTPLLKPGGGGVRPIAVGTIWRRLVSKVGAFMVGPLLSGYFSGLQFGVGVPGGGEAILHALNRLVEAQGDVVGQSMLLVDFQNAFNMVDRGCLLQEVRLRCPALSRWVEFCYGSPARLFFGEHCMFSCQGVQQGDPLGPLLFALVLHPLVCKIRDSFDLTMQAWYLDDGTIVGDTLVVGRVLELIMEEGPRRGLFLNVDKSEVFWPSEDPRSRVEGVFPPGISRPQRGVKVLGGPVSTCPAFCCELVLKRVARTVELMDSLARLDDPQCELLLLRVCTGISKLYFALRTCPPRAVRAGQLCFDASLRSTLERIVVASGPGFGDWQWRLATLPFSFGGLGVYAADDVLHYAFLASRVQTEVLQGALLSRAGISVPGASFDDAVRTFEEVTGSDFFRGREIAAPRLMKTLADIYFTSVAARAESGFSLSARQVALWKSQQEAHAGDWLRVVPISGLGQVMNGRTYRCVLGYRLGIPLFSASGSCSACSRVLEVDVYGDHAVSCAGVVGLKHRHNLVRDTLLDICSRSGISAAREVDVGLLDREDRPLRPADVLLYSWDGGKDVCVDLTGSSPLTQSALAAFVPGQAVVDAASRKRAKYQEVCASKGYGFLPFSFSSLGELDAAAAAFLKRVQKFASSQDAGARAAPFIFPRIGFAIARGVGAQLVSRLPTNFL